MATLNISGAAVIGVLMLCFRVDVAEIVTMPAGTEAVIGRTTYINCSTNSPQEVHWFHTPVGSTQDRNFVYGYQQFYPPYSGRMTLEKKEASGAYNLIIPSVRVEDAGLYECQDQNGQGKKASAQLTVLDTDPACEPRIETLLIIGPNPCGIESSQLILSCAVKYNGNEAPIMKWSKKGNNAAISEGVTHQITDNKFIAYNLTIDGNSAVNDGDSYFCNTTRSATLNGGCKSGTISIQGTDASEVCQPYIKPYIAAIICIFLIILPAAIAGTLLVFWYLKMYRRKKNEAAKPDEMNHLNSPKSTEKNDRQSNNINDLKAEIKQLRNTNTDTSKKLKNLETEAERSADQLRKKSNEIIQLNARLSDLESSLYPAGNIDYAEKPTFVQKIITDAEDKERRKPISGMAILSKELFVSFENISMIDVYDAESFQFVLTWEITEMSHPMDLASCNTANCIYVIHQEDNVSQSQIVKLKPKGQFMTKWSTDGNNGRLSTYKSNVIVCLFEKQLINEYSGDGNLVHTVRLSPAVGFNHPWHAIKVTGSHFAVCHGDAKDELHRVCIVDADGNIIKKIGEWKKNFTHNSRKLDFPVCLLEDSERSILVADRNNQQIIILNCLLKYQRNLVTRVKRKEEFDNSLVRICLDENKGRLFVAENTLNSSTKEGQHGRVLIYDIKYM